MGIMGKKFLVTRGAEEDNCGGSLNKNEAKKEGNHGTPPSVSNNPGSAAVSASTIGQDAYYNCSRTSPCTTFGPKMCNSEPSSVQTDTAQTFSLVARMEYLHVVIRSNAC